MAKQFFIVIFLILWKYSSGLSPVILISGLASTRLEAKYNKPAVVHGFCKKEQYNYQTIWIDLKELFNFPLPIADCWVDNVRLIYDNVTRKTQNSPGVEIRAPGWGTTEPVEWLDVYGFFPYFFKLAQVLARFGYERNRSLRAAPYDFRRAANEAGKFFAQLKALVEETYTMNGNSSVTLLTHSMGGLMARQFLKLQTRRWKHQYIKRFIALAAPWGGSMKALQALLAGIEMDFHIGKLLVNSTQIRRLVRTWPSVTWLLPSHKFWRPKEALVVTPNFKYTIRDLHKLFVELNMSVVWEMRKDTAALDRHSAAPGVEMHCLFGTGVPTVDSLYYEPGKSFDDKPTVLNGDGDGTVNLRSLSGCIKWAHRRRHFPVKIVPIPNVNHMDILSDHSVFRYIIKVLALDLN